MKRLLCMLLTLALVLVLCPLALLASAEEVGWSGSGDEVRASVSPDNTKNYEINCDLHLPGLTTGTENGASPDDVMLKIRQTTADHYIIFRVKTYRNADGKFQIQGQQQFYSGNWSDTVTAWSEDMDAPLNDVHVRLAYNAATAVYTWTISDAQGAKLCGGETDPAQLTSVFKSATACELAFKRGNSDILPTNTTYTATTPEAPAEFDETKTPADFGWSTDGDNFTGWQVSTDGKLLQVTYDGTNSKRIWKELLTNAKDFTLSFTTHVLNKRVELELLGVKLELNTENGNGNQIYTKDTDWFDAADQTCKVELSRANGGDLQIKLIGDKTVQFTKPVADESGTNLFLGVIDNGGSARFSDLTVTSSTPTPDPDPEPPTDEHTPDEFGWQTDEENFNGWTATDGRNITADAAKAAFEGWIYKELVTDTQDFTATLDLLPTTVEASGSIKILGVELELDARHGNGNEVCVKINRSDRGWLNAEGRACHIEMKRTAGGTVDITVTGAGNDKPFRFSASPADDSKNLNLCVYAGITKFQNIRVVTADQPLPTHTVTWSVNGVETTEVYDEDAMPVFKGDTSKPSDGEFVYTFTGWEPALAPVTADVTYTAQYSKTPVTADHFTITWIVDGKQTVETCPAGEVPVFHGETAKAADARYTYTFVGWDTEPVAAVADATYTAVYSRTLRVITPDDGFGDVTKNDWFYADVYTATGYGLFSGTAQGVFSPNASMTRGMLVTVLYRLEGEPAHTAENPFGDIAAKDWYYDAVLWAAENGIVNGVGSGAFDPNGNVTREQIAAILLRYAEKKGYSADRRESIAYFPDSASVSGYAQDAMAWAVAEGLIGGSKSGDKTYLQPQGNATRAQVAAILVRFIRNIAN